MVLGEEAEFFLFDNKGRSRKLGRITDSISCRHGHGGQSQNRLARLREGQIHRYLEQVEENIRRFYTKEGLTEIRKLILFGSGQKKEQVRDRIGWLSCPVITLSLLDLKSVEEKFFRIVGEDVKEDSQAFVDEIKEFIRVDPNRLVFGEADVREQYSLNLLERVWCRKNEGFMRNDKTGIVQVQHHFIDDFGGFVGLLRHSQVVAEKAEETQE